MQNGQPVVLGDFNQPDPGFQMVPPDEVAQLGLPPGAYQRGADGRITQVGGGGVTVNTGDTGPRVGTLSQDYGYILDPDTGQPRIDPETGMPMAAPVPGSPAWQANRDQEESDAAGRRNASDYARTVTQDIGIALNYLDQLGPMSGMDGVVGANLRRARANVAGTPEFNMSGFVESALSNLTLDTMNRMRETSAAGATGMGNMSNQQLRVIQGVLGQWSPALPLEDQRFILGRLGNFYLDVQVGTRAEREQAVRDGRITAEENAEIEGMYWPDQRDAIGRPAQAPTPAPAPPVGGMFGADASGQQPSAAPAQGQAPSWMIDTDPSTWTEEQMQEAERIWGLR
jgi:hypothetical protein